MSSRRLPHVGKSRIHQLCSPAEMSATGTLLKPGMYGGVKASENGTGVRCVQLGNEANDPLPQITSVERKHIRNMQQSSSTSSSKCPTRCAHHHTCDRRLLRAAWLASARRFQVKTATRCLHPSSAVHWWWQGCQILTHSSLQGESLPSATATLLAGCFPLQHRARL